ncbi:MAG TPA: hypothetical protein PLD25_10085 [Chloroflexota bacterium]|nr:hypothetical protein [Chloroflexota bacterium]
MSDSQSQAGKYVVHHPVQSAIGDYAQVNNYLSPQAAATDPGVAELRQLFEQVNEKLAALETADRELLSPAVAQTAKVTAEIQQGDDNPEKQSFLEARLKAIYAMRQDIGEVIIASLASPTAGIALTIQKIAQKAKGELGLD